MPISTGSEFKLAVCDALGLNYVTRLEIVFEIDEPVKVTATFLADDSLSSIIKKFELSAVQKD